MKIHGSFINRLGDTVAVEITTRTGGAADMEIGTEEAGLWFDADPPVAIRAEANGTDDVLLRHSCTIRLLSRSFVPSLFCASCLDAVAMVSSNGRCVFAGSADKDLSTVLRLLSPVVDAWVLPPVRSPRILPAAELADLVRACSAAPVSCPATLAEALRELRPGTLICGSFFLIGEAKALLSSADYRQTAQ